MTHRDDDSVRPSFLIGQKESESSREFLVISENGPCLVLFPFLSLFMSLNFKVNHSFSSLSLDRLSVVFPLLGVLAS